MKKSYTTDDLLQYLEGRLPGASASRLERDLADSPALSEKLARVRATRALLRQTANEAGEDVLLPFFTDRLMKKLAPQEAAPVPSLDEELALSLSRLFRPVAILGLFLALCLAVYNINLSNDYTSNPSTAESILAMPPLTSTAIYDMDYYATQSITATDDSQNMDMP